MNLELRMSAIPESPSPDAIRIWLSCVNRHMVRVLQEFSDPVDTGAKAFWPIQKLSGTRSDHGVMIFVMPEDGYFNPATKAELVDLLYLSGSPDDERRLLEQGGSAAVMQYVHNSLLQVERVLQLKELRGDCLHHWVMASTLDWQLLLLHWKRAKLRNREEAMISYVKDILSMWRLCPWIPGMINAAQPVVVDDLSPTPQDAAMHGIRRAIEKSRKK